MSDKSVLEYAEGMADALGDGTWKDWSQEQAHEVEEVLDSLRAMVRDRERERDEAIVAFKVCKRAVEATQAFIKCGQQPTLDPGGSGEYRKKRWEMEQAHAAAVAALARKDG